MERHEYGVPPGYDSCTPERTNKRNTVQTKECGNCGREFYADYGEYFPPSEANYLGYDWCSPECFLSHSRSSMYPRQYSRLEAAVNTLERRRVTPRPSRFDLERFGGTVTLDEYLQGAEEVTVEAGTKRVRIIPDANTAEVNTQIPWLDDADHMTF